MRKFKREVEETFTVFNPNKYYAGKIGRGSTIVDLQSVELQHEDFKWNLCSSSYGSFYSGRGFKVESIFNIFAATGDVCYEFDTAKEKYQWISDNL